MKKILSVLCQRSGEPKRIIAPCLWRVVFVLIFIMSLTVAYGFEETDLLKPDQAFVLTAVKEQDADTVVATWSIAEGYYLYRERFRFESATSGLRLGEPHFPQGKIKEDKFFGQMEIYRNSVSIKIPIFRDKDAPTHLALKTVYQGCVEIGICYPPQTRTVTVDLSPPPRTNLLKVLTASKNLSGFGQPRQDQLLEPDQAFILSLTAADSQTLVARWDIAKGYYLYRDKLQLSLLNAEGVHIASLDIPPGQAQEDEFFGLQQVFYDQAIVTAHLQSSTRAAHDLNVKVDYQGCAEIGVCYPPMSQTIPVTLGLSVAAKNPVIETDIPNETPAPEAEQDRIAHLLEDQRFWALPAFFGFGLLLAFTPCVFPMIPILSGLIVGQGQQLSRRRAFSLSLIYVFAMAVTYTFAGIMAASLGENIQALFQNPWILIGFSALFVLLALSMFGFYDLQLPSRWQGRLAELSNRQRGGSYTGVAVMGLLSALIVGPCVAPPLIGILTVIGATGDTVLGGTALFALSLGMGAPLVVIGASAGHWLPRAGPWMNRIKAVFGVLLLAVALWLLERVLPAAVIMVLWAILLIVSAVYMDALQPSTQSHAKWHPLVKGLGVVLMIYGILLLVGAAAGGRDPLQPLRDVRFIASGNIREPMAFQPIETVNQLQQALARAKSRPVMLDFYADWCVSCQELEKYTFSDPAVQTALVNTVLLQADVTDNNAEDQALLRHFGLVGPPAILFFGEDGIERRAYRLVGFVPADIFQRHIEKALRSQGVDMGS
jgi:thiol:disulfide interchange protein DsbD